MPPPRPRGVGYNTGVTATRPSANAPMSERQQMALLIQMTAANTTEIPRSHLKKNELKKNEDVEESNLHEKQDAHSTNRDKSAPDELNVDNKKDNHHADHANTSDASASSSNLGKRNFSDIEEEDYDDCDDVKKKKRKDSENNKETKTTQNSRAPTRVDKNVKQTSAAAKSTPTCNKTPVAVEKDPPENNLNKTFVNDGDEEDYKLTDSLHSGGLKVPPLKIVIPQQNCSIDTDGNVSRTGKVNTSRGGAALPYVVSSNNEASEREAGSPHESPVKVNTLCTAIDEKNAKLTNEEKNLHRVLRSSHRTGVERSSNNSSPQMHSSSPSPASSNANEAAEGKSAFANMTTSPSQQNATFEHENIVNLPSPSTSSTSSSKEIHSNNSELHPRKRKIRSKNDESHLRSNSSQNNTNTEPTSTISDSHPHDFPFTNCFQMYLNIRRQIEKKWKNLDSVKPRPPQGYNEYLINKRTYLLSSNKERNTISIPHSVSPKMREIFLIQAKERNELFQRHTVEREKLCLNVEQEIIRVHSKAVRNQSLQSVPYSVCTLLKDEEVYNVITPEQEEKDRNARHRFNGRLLFSWLQDVDDKWEKIKESLVLRQQNEAESLHAVQVMDWEIALKKYELCDYKSHLIVEKDHVPIIHVSDDFDLLPA